MVVVLRQVDPWTRVRFLQQAQRPWLLQVTSLPDPEVTLTWPLPPALMLPAKVQRGMNRLAEEMIISADWCHLFILLCLRLHLLHLLVKIKPTYLFSKNVNGFQHTDENVVCRYASASVSPQVCYEKLIGFHPLLCAFAWLVLETVWLIINQSQPGPKVPKAEQKRIEFRWGRRQKVISLWSQWFESIRFFAFCWVSSWAK